MTCSKLATVAQCTSNGFYWSLLYWCLPIYCCVYIYG